MTGSGIGPPPHRGAPAGERPWEERPCWRCDGEGSTFAVYGQLDTYEECWVCEGTGLANQTEPDRAESINESRGDES